MVVKEQVPNNLYLDKSYDLVIKNGTVLDPKTETVAVSNIGISRGKILIITNENIHGSKMIDAQDKIVSPGFIDFHSHVDGKQYTAECIARQGGTTTIGGERDFDGIIIKQIGEEGFLIHHGFFISHSFTLRIAAGIDNPYRAATRKEIEEMMYLAEIFLQNGAFGIHFGLEFFPGTSEEEIMSLAKTCQRYNRIISVHLRKDGREALNYFDEIIHAAEVTGVSVQILQLMYMVGINGAMGKALEIIENAREKGIDITADSGVYDAFCACIGTSIFDKGWEAEYGERGYEALLISSGIYTGRYCDEELFYRLREDFPHTSITAFVCDTDDIPLALSKPYVYVSTNAADGPHYPEMGHPEVAGTFPRLIGRYVREKKTLSLMEAIKKITILPAERLGIKNKGWIGVGADADIVIFDFNTIIDRADYLGAGMPDAPPDGIEYVIVSGEIIVENGILYPNKKPGRLLKWKKA